MQFSPPLLGDQKTQDSLTCKHTEQGKVYITDNRGFFFSFSNVIFFFKKKSFLKDMFANGKI